MTRAPKSPVSSVAPGAAPTLSDTVAPVETINDQDRQHEAQADRNVAKLEVQKAGELPDGAPDDMVAPFVLRGELHTNLTKADIAQRWPQDAKAILAEASKK